jgi:DNA-binding NarL/FixJ family response regulator
MLTLLARGMRAKEVADRLGIERKSVETSMEVARKRLGARNTTHAVVKALRAGLIDLNQL